MIILSFRRICLILFLIFVFQSVLAQAPDPDFTDKTALRERLYRQKSASFIESADYASTDLIYQQLNVTVDPAINQISGSVYSLLKIKNEQVPSIHFDLNSSLVVDSIQYNQKRIDFQHTNDKINLTLSAPALKNSICSVQIYYHGSPPQNGMGSFTISKHNNIPVLWTLSEPYGAKVWWPCKESLADKIDSLDVFITCPSQYKAASNGKLISDEITLNKRTAHWKHRYPIATYLVGIAVTNYETYAELMDLPNGKKLEILNYIYPEYLTTAQSKSNETRDIMNFYCQKFITYPFASEKYGHAQFGWNGGMEHQTMSFMINLDFELVAHEMSHQWFGDYITLGSWHDIWLNEGFATYLTGLTYENLMNGVWWPIWKNNQLTRIISSAGGSVYVADTTDIDRIFNSRLSYSKGAYLLHMLRWELGDSSFFKGLKNYLNDPVIANGFASQTKFVKHMETAADTSLTEFFNDWYYGEGYPTFTLTYFPDPVNPLRQKLRISQAQSYPSVSFFEVTVPVRIWKDGKSKDIRPKLTRQNQEFDISNEPFDYLEFDPDKWLIAKLDKISPVLHVSEIKEIQIVPESSLKKIWVQIPDLSGDETLRIMDLSGKAIINITLVNEDSWVDVSSLKSGIYLVEVRTKDQQKTAKILVN